MAPPPPFPSEQGQVSFVDTEPEQPHSHPRYKERPRQGKEARKGGKSSSEAPNKPRDNSSSKKVQDQDWRKHFDPRQQQRWGWASGYAADCWCSVPSSKCCVLRIPCLNCVLFAYKYLVFTFYLSRVRFLRFCCSLPCNIVTFVNQMGSCLINLAFSFYNLNGTLLCQCDRGH